MAISLRLLAGLILLGALLAAIAVLGDRGGTGSAGQSLPPVLKVNRIAYVDLDGQIHTVNPTGFDDRRISPEVGFFTWPTWSPDARRLVFSGVVDGNGGDPKISLYALNNTSGRISEIYAGEPGVTGVLASGVVHYSLWSPDSRQLAFVAVTSRGLTLLLDDLQENVDADYVLDQGPLWISWSPDSRYLLAHRDADHFLVDTQDGIQVNELDIRSAGYRVASWKPLESTIIVASKNGPGGSTLVTAEVADGVLDAPRLKFQGSPNPAFLWSSNGEVLAVTGSSRAVIYQGLFTRIYDGLTMIYDDDAKPPLEIRENVFAFFWSPDGTKLAYVTISNTPGVLRWMVMNAADGNSWPLVDFIPSRNQLTMFQFFDQFAYSHSLWSPDSGSLVFAGVLSTEAISASLSAHRGHLIPNIIVVDASPQPSNLIIAPGEMGFWSPK